MPKMPAMPCMAVYTCIVNEDTSNNHYDIESLHGEYAYLSGSFTSEQLRIVADAMDELAEAHDRQLPSADYARPNK